MLWVELTTCFTFSFSPPLILSHLIYHRCLAKKLKATQLVFAYFHQYQLNLHCSLPTSIYQPAPEVTFCCFSVDLFPNLRLLSSPKPIDLRQPLSTCRLSRLQRDRMSRPDSGYLEVPPAVCVCERVSQRQTESVLSGGGKVEQRKLCGSVLG